MRACVLASKAYALAFEVLHAAMLLAQIRLDQLVRLFTDDEAAIIGAARLVFGMQLARECSTVARFISRAAMTSECVCTSHRHTLASDRLCWFHLDRNLKKALADAGVSPPANRLIRLMWRACSAAFRDDEARMLYDALICALPSMLTGCRSGVLESACVSTGVARCTSSLFVNCGCHLSLTHTLTLASHIARTGRQLLPSCGGGVPRRLRAACTSSRWA